MFFQLFRTAILSDIKRTVGVKLACCTLAECLKRANRTALRFDSGFKGIATYCAILYNRNELCRLQQV